MLFQTNEQGRVCDEGRNDVKCRLEVHFAVCKVW